MPDLEPIDGAPERPESTPSAFERAAVPPSPAAPPEHRRRGPSVLGTVLVAAVVAAVVGSFAGLAGYAIGRSVDPAQTAAVETAIPVTDAAALPDGQPIGGSIADIVAGTLPAVVSIVVEGDVQAGSGSGFVIRRDGYIVTNNHVVDLADDGGKLTVVFADGEEVKGEVVGTNASYDLAVVKVDRRGLPVVPLGDSSRVDVGDVAIAIGAPLGLEGTVTSGIISAVDRPVIAGESEADLSYINAIQTDAAINPGNSGGPLLDDSGRVIGVNSAIATLAIGGEAGSIGLGFAIPSNSARRVAEEIIATGSSRTPLMGVQLDSAYSDTGAKVGEVNRGGGAEDAGLATGDVIIRVDDRVIDDATELVVTIRTYAPGDTVEIGYLRDGEERSVRLVLGDDGQDG